MNSNITIKIVKNLGFKFLMLNNSSDAEDEYIAFTATKNLYMHEYIVFDSTYDKNDTLSNIDRHFFWFPSKDVKKGEIISINTGKGTYSKYFDKDLDTYIHEFYWGSGSPIWNNTGDKCHIIKVDLPPQVIKIS